MRASDLLNLEVWTESGERLGRAHDLRAELTSGSLKITGVCVGGWGLLERLGVSSPESSGRIHTHDLVPWSAVLRADRRGIVVRDGGEAEIGFEPCPSISQKPTSSPCSAPPRP